MKTNEYITFFVEVIGVGGRLYEPFVKFSVKDDAKFYYVGNDKIDKQKLNEDMFEIGQIKKPRNNYGKC